MADEYNDGNKKVNNEIELFIFEVSKHTDTG